MDRDRGAPSGAGRLLRGLAVTALVLAAGFVALSVWPELQRADALALLASFAPLGVLAAGLAAVLTLALLVAALVRRSAGRRLPALGLALSLLALATLLAPSISLSRAVPSGGGDLTVVALNLQEGQADVADLEAAATGADVLVLSEVTPDAQRRVLASGLADQLPFRGGEGAGRLAGTTVLSRYPLETVAVLDLSFQQRLVRIQVPDLGTVHVLAVHPISPLGGPDRWRSEHRRLVELVGTVDEGPVVVAGDFNAVDQHLVMRHWRDAGLVDAGRSAGAGWLPTWPAEGVLPPVLGIDHVLTTSDLQGVDVTTFEAAGSDHRGIRALLAATDRD